MTRMDRRESGRIILAHGEVTGHHHEIVTATDAPPDLDRAQYFEEPNGTRTLLVLGTDPLFLRHEEHGRITIDPAEAAAGAQGLLIDGRLAGQYRQGDVLLHPIGAGAWRVVRQAEHTPDGWRQVAD